MTYVTYRRGWNRRENRETLRELSCSSGWEVLAEISVCPEHIEEFEATDLPAVEKKVVETYLDRKKRFLFSVVKTAEDLEREAAEAHAAQVAEAGAEEWDDWDL